MFIYLYKNASRSDARLQQQRNKLLKPSKEADVKLF